MAAEQRTGYLGLGSNVGDSRRPPARRDRAARSTGDRGRGRLLDLRDRAGRRDPRPARLPQRRGPHPHRRSSPKSCSTSARRSRPSAAAPSTRPRHSPRPLDVDLLLLGDLELSTERLTLPHREVTTPPLRPRPAARARPGAGAPGRDPARRRARRARRPGSGSSRSGRSPRPRRLAAQRRRASRAGSTGGVWPGKSGTSRSASCAGGPVLDRRAQVVERHRQADAGGDLEVGGVRLRRRRSRRRRSRRRPGRAGRAAPPGRRARSRRWLR